MPGNWHVRFGGGPYGKGPANCGHLAIRPTQPLAGSGSPGVARNAMFERGRWARSSVHD